MIATISLNISLILFIQCGPDGITILDRRLLGLFVSSGPPDKNEEWAFKVKAIWTHSRFFFEIFGCQPYTILARPLILHECMVFIAAGQEGVDWLITGRWMRKLHLLAGLAGVIWGKKSRDSKRGAGVSYFFRYIYLTMIDIAYRIKQNSPSIFRRGSRAAKGIRL